MFGYVRPNKGELLIREFSRFRSVYCGICKEIGNSYGQVPRIALTYDITMLGVLLNSLDIDEPVEEMQRCILNPVKKRPMQTHSQNLHRCAALSVLLANGKFIDEIQDGNPVIGNFGKVLLKKATHKASKEYPVESLAISEGLKKLREIEKNMNIQSDGNLEPLYEMAANQFGEILEIIFKQAFSSFFLQDPHREILIKGIGILAFNLGKWIFIIDAIDDYEQDIKTGNWSPFIYETKEKAHEIALGCLAEYEKEIDQVAALLPYKRDAGIISNIIQNGLPFVRQKIFLHQKMGRL